MRNDGLPGSLASWVTASLLRPLMRTTDTNTFGMSFSLIGTRSVCCVDVSSNSFDVRTPSRSVVSSAVESRRDDLGIEAHLRVGKVRRRPEADVPRRRIDAE